MPCTRRVVRMPRRESGGHVGSKADRRSISQEVRVVEEDLRVRQHSNAAQRSGKPQQEAVRGRKVILRQRSAAFASQRTTGHT